MRIETNKLSRGQAVWYCYEYSSVIMGPFTVKQIIGTHEGSAVVLITPSGDRIVKLAPDDDYGEPIFFDGPEG